MSASAPTELESLDNPVTAEAAYGFLQSARTRMAGRIRMMANFAGQPKSQSPLPRVVRLPRYISRK